MSEDIRALVMNRLWMVKRRQYVLTP